MDMFDGRKLAALTVHDLVRANNRLVVVFADLGIGPRYLYWTVESAVADLGINMDRVVARLSRALGGTPALSAAR